MAASEAAVAAAQAKAGCWFEETAAGLFCNAHHCYADQRHETRDECDVIAAIADAAVDADRASIQAEALREAALAVESACSSQGGPCFCTSAPWLGARADRIEAQP